MQAISVRRDEIVRVRENGYVRENAEVYKMKSDAPDRRAGQKVPPPFRTEDASVFGWVILVECTVRRSNLHGSLSAEFIQCPDVSALPTPEEWLSDCSLERHGRKW